MTSKVVLEMSVSKTLPAILALASSVLLLLSSILCMAFKMTAFDSYMRETSQGNDKSGYGLRGYGPDERSWMYLYPDSLMDVNPKPVIAASSFGLIIGLGVTVLTIWSLKTKKSVQLKLMPQKFVLAMLGATALLVTIVMIYELVQNGRSARFDPTYFPGSGYYDKGLFSLETWSCDTLGTFPDFEEHDFGQQCLGERASRGLLVVLCVSSLAMLGNLIWDFETTQVVFARQVLNKAEWGEDGWY